MNIASASTASPAERFATKAAAMTNAELVESHGRVAAQVATLPLSHPQWDVACAAQSAYVAELMSRLA